MDKLIERYKKGSILKRKIWYTIVFSHMGIYVGNDEVIHFDRRRDSNSSVRKISLDEFARGRKIMVHAEPKNAEHAETIVEEAEILLKHHRLPGTYQLFNNCEDFVARIYGKEYVPLVQRNYVFILLFLVLNIGILPALLIIQIMAYVNKRRKKARKR